MFLLTLLCTRNTQTYVCEFKYLILEFIILFYISINHVCVCVYIYTFIWVAPIEDAEAQQPIIITLLRGP